MNEFWPSDSVKPETHGFRDESISRRHRLWGFNCPAVDIDFLMVEYNVGKPVALVEYKYYLAKRPDFAHATYRSLRLLADGYNEGPLPFFLSLYSRDDWSFRVIPVNDTAKQHFQDGEHLSELEYVKRLYRMRRMVLAATIMPNLNTNIIDK